jgi:hypothetical protein
MCSSKLCMQALLVLLLVAPTVGWAQAHLSPNIVKPAVPSVREALTKSVNPRYLNLATGRFLYRHLRDTVGTRYTRPLPAGNWELDIVRFVSPHWLAVRWRGADTTTYYLPRVGAQTIILL